MTDLPMNGYEARDMLIDCVTLLEQERCVRPDIVTVHDRSASGHRAEQRVREAFEMIGADYERPNLRTVVEAAEALADREAVGHPDFAWHLDRFAAHCMQEAVR